MPNRISKYQVVAQLGSCHVRRDMGKSERVGGQDSLHTTGGSSGFLRSATVVLHDIHVCATYLYS
jgi:hypothetical protein